MKATRSALVVGLFLLLSVAGLHAAAVTGSAREVGTNIVHPNGNVYDQVLLTGSAATVEADPGQVTRVSLIDLNDDIIQIELGGKGRLTIALDNASGPAAPAKYNQPGVEYMRGHASLTIAGCDATTNISVFSVGRCNAVNQSLFPAGVTYDGIADLARLTIVTDPSNPGGISTFGGIRMGNAQFYESRGTTGIVANNVNVQGPVIIGDVSALLDATPMLIFGVGSQFATLTVAGGDLFQQNGRAIVISGFQGFNMTGGATSDCGTLTVQPNRGTFVAATGTP
jgi:hypothetical protein